MHRKYSPLRMEKYASKWEFIYKQSFFVIIVQFRFIFLKQSREKKVLEDSFQFFRPLGQANAATEQHARPGHQDDAILWSGQDGGLPLREGGYHWPRQQAKPAELQTGKVVPLSFVRNPDHFSGSGSASGACQNRMRIRDRNWSVRHKTRHSFCKFIIWLMLITHIYP